MRFDFNFYSSLLLLFFIHGLVYSFLLLKKGIITENKSNYWLSFFLLLCSLFLAPWMLGFAGWYDNQPYRNILFYTPFQHLFLIGPTIFFYTQSLLNPAFQLTRKNSWHFLPGVMYLIYILFLFIYDVFVVKETYFYADGMDKDFEYWYQKTGLLFMIVYFVLSLKYYNKYKKLMLQIVSFAESVLFKWMKHFLITFLIMLILPVIFDVLGYFFPELNSYVGTWWFFLLFAICMYYIAISGYSNHVIGIVPFEMSVFSEKPILLLETPQHTTIESIDIEQEAQSIEISTEILEWKQKIQDLVWNENLYQNPELTLTDVAKKLQSNSAVISRAINQGFSMNFNDFINYHRIEKVKEAFQNKEHITSTLLGIAFDCGFNSKATFNRAFKKHTGLSPKDYIHTI